MFGRRRIKGEPPLDALCYRTISERKVNDPNDKGTTNAASCSNVTRNSDAILNSNNYDQSQLQTGLANPSSDNSQLDIVDLHEITVHADVDKPEPEGQQVSNGNQNDKTRLSRRQIFFSFFRRSNSKNVPSIPQKRTKSFMTFTSGQSISNITMDSDISNEELKNTHKTEMTSRRKGSLFGMLFSSRQKTSKSQDKGKDSSKFNKDLNTASNLPEASSQVDTSGTCYFTETQTTFQEDVSKMDETETGCLGCSNCEDNNRERLVDEESTCPVDSANDYLAALQELLKPEETHVNDYVTKGKKQFDISINKTNQSNANNATGECGIFKVSNEDRNARGPGYAAKQASAGVTNQNLHETLPKSGSNENSRFNLDENQTNIATWKLSTTQDDCLENNMSSTVAISTDNLNLSSKREQINTAGRNSSISDGTLGDEKVLKENDDAEAANKQTSNVRRRAMSEASIFKPLFASKKSGTFTSKLQTIEQYREDASEELYPVDFDDVAVDLEPNSGAVRFYPDRQELCSDNSCDNKLDSLAEDEEKKLHNADKTDTRPFSVSVESINGLCLSKEADQSENMDQRRLKNQQATTENTERLISPLSPRKGLTGKLGKNMDKPKIKGTTASSPLKIRSRSGSLPVLFATKDSSAIQDQDQSVGLQKLGAIHEMDSDGDNYYKDKSHERKRKRSVFSGPGKNIEDISRSKVRRSRTSVHETKVF